MWHQPFDLQYWFVNVLAGDMGIFIGLAFLIIAIISGFFKMPNIITLTMFILFATIFSLWLGTPLMVLAGIMVAIFFGWALSRMFR